MGGVSRSRILLAAAIAALALAVYAPVRGLPFLLYDDQTYVTENRYVQTGLDADGVRWALTSFYASNWHPLTWLSHMLDTSLFGQSPAGPHLENALLHALCAVLVFLLLDALTAAQARAAAVAVLFAVHPQHVESVAWISERKDLLCALFGLLAALAWIRWARDGSRLGYGAALACMALGLLAKPMLVSLPLLLLALDYWPLARRLDPRLLLEKVPFAALALASSLVTLRAQTTAMQIAPSLAERLANACVALWQTLAQGFVPIGLAPLYPHPGQWPFPEVALAAAAVLGLSALAAALRVRAPYLASGWFWFVCALGPTLGLVQVGFQSHADRYAYLSQIGVAWALVWSAGDLLVRVRAPRAVGPALVAAAALALALVTRAQLAYWTSDLALWQRVLAVTGPNFFAETELGIELTARGRYAEALPHFVRSLEIQPHWPRGEANYGFALYMSGDTAAAVPHFERSLELDPNPTGDSEVHLYYARALADAGRPAEALAHYETQLALSPDDRGAMMGIAELRATEPAPPLRDGAEALRQAKRACTLGVCAYPEEIDVLALAFAAAGDPAMAAKLAQEGIERARAIDAQESLARLERHLAVFQAGRAVTEPER